MKPNQGFSIEQHFDNLLTEVYLTFYHAVLPTFTSINNFLQQETPCVHLIHKLQSFLTTILRKFVKISVSRTPKIRKNLIKVGFVSTGNQLPDSTLFIGFITKQILNKLGDIRDSEMKRFYKGCAQLLYYNNSVHYKNIPLE